MAKQEKEAGSIIPLEHIYLHQAISIPGMLYSEKTVSLSKMKDIETMFWLPGDCVRVSFKGGKVARIPLANVAGAAEIV